MGLRWNRVAWLSLAASCVLGPAGCSDEDEPDPKADASTDPRTDPRTDTSPTPDVSADRGPDQRDTGAPDGGTPDGSCVGGGDAARDGVAGRALVELLRCANCHQDEPVDAGLLLSGRITLAGDSGIYPKNLTPDPVTGLGCWTDQQIMNAFMNGINEQGQMLCTRMPRFSTRGIDAGNAQAIVDFLRTVPAVQKAIPETTNCPPPPTTEPQPEGGIDADGGAPPDGPAPDAGPDTAPPEAGPDAGPDTAPPEAGPDTTAPDAGPDAAPDAGPDTAAPDAGIDVEPDTDDGASIDVDIDGG